MDKLRIVVGLRGIELYSSSVACRTGRAGNPCSPSSVSSCARVAGPRKDVVRLINVDKLERKT